MRAPGGPRLLLRRLREVMAEPVTAQARLDRIVVLIASNMVAEVCSLYVARADGPLELYATEGLNREAVHLTTMLPGEGLVGLIAATAEPLALSDAQNHPPFSYKPETGEEIYQSFLGVPVLRGGATLGVLVVQNRARRTYSEEEIEALQTTAMLLAEMIASGELQSIAGQARGDRRAASGIVDRPADRRGAGPRPCRAAPAAHRGGEDRRRRHLDGARPAGQGDRGDARLGRRADRPQRRRQLGRASRGARGVPDDRPRPRLAAPPARGGGRAASPPRRRSSGCRTTRAPACNARPTPTCAIACTT